MAVHVVQIIGPTVVEVADGLEVFPVGPQDLEDQVMLTPLHHGLQQDIPQLRLIN